MQVIRHLWRSFKGNQAEAQALAKDHEIDALKVEIMAFQCQINGMLKVVM